jgi:N6-adenosine-specific RNA methylase IME4
MTALTKYDAACRALAEAHRVDEVKRIRDAWVAMQAYAQQAKDETLIRHATEIRMRAERKAGVLLIEMAERKERHSGKPTKGSRVATPTSVPTLSDLKITKTQSSRWQQLARVPEDRFERNVERASTDAYDRMAGRFIKEQEIERAKARHRKLIEHGCTVADLESLNASGKRFSVIYADPPWPWDGWGPRGEIHSSPNNHYNTCSLDEIAALPVARLAADNCALLLWCTGPHIAIGTHVEVIRRWGFRPSTIAFAWVKQVQCGDRVRKSGMGYWTTANMEAVFLAIRGSPLRLATDVQQIVMAPVGKHSAKPEEVRRRIERLFPGPYLELYGRKPVPGWTVWGNEIKRGEMGGDDAPPTKVEAAS